MYLWKMFMRQMYKNQGIYTSVWFRSGPKGLLGIGNLRKKKPALPIKVE